MISLKVITPNGPFLEQEVKSIHARSTEGHFTLLPNHIPIVFSLVPCKLELTEPDGKKEIFAISGGFLRFENNEATLICEGIEGSRQIDLERAQAAYKRARKRLEKHDESVDLQRAELSLQRAINRMNVANSKNS